MIFSFKLHLINILTHLIYSFHSSTDNFRSIFIVIGWCVCCNASTHTFTFDFIWNKQAFLVFLKILFQSSPFPTKLTHHSNSSSWIINMKSKKKESWEKKKEKATARGRSEWIELNENYDALFMSIFFDSIQFNSTSITVYVHFFLFSFHLFFKWQMPCFSHYTIKR